MAKKDPSKTTRTSVDTIIFTREEAGGWCNPPFQRPLRINAKVLELAKEIDANGGVIPGILTLGRVVGSPVSYLLDGQHRRASAMQTKLDAFYADVRVHTFDDMGEMGEEFVRLNTALVRLRPDDILRGLEGSTEWMRAFRKAAPFVGYDMIRRSEKAPIVSMSLVLRAWIGSSQHVPGSSMASSATFVKIVTPDESAMLMRFIQLCWNAWGREEATRRLWGGLNLTLCAWLYRRLVLTRWSPKTPAVSAEMFGKCLAALAASEQYMDFLVARTMSDRNRSPGYDRIKAAFAKRIQLETKADKVPLLPAPDWANNSAKVRGYV